MKSKGIAPEIAAIIIMLVAISVGFLVANFIMNVSSMLVSKSIVEILGQPLFYCSSQNNQGYVYVTLRNIGSKDLEIYAGTVPVIDASGKVIGNGTLRDTIIIEPGSEKTIVIEIISSVDLTSLPQVTVILSTNAGPLKIVATKV